MHNHGGKNNSQVIWMMLLFALILVILLLAGGNLFSAGYLWPILIVGFILVHFWMMLRGHRSQDRGPEDDFEQGNDAVNSAGVAHSVHEEHKSDKKKHHSGGCCH